MPWTMLSDMLSNTGLCMTGYLQMSFLGQVIDNGSKGKQKKYNNSKQADAVEKAKH